jgi:hypothetical protein
MPVPDDDVLSQTVDEISVRLKGMDTPSLAGRLTLSNDVHELLSTAKVPWSLIADILKAGFETYRTIGGRQLEWACDPVIWEPLLASADGRLRRGVRYHDSRGKAPVSVIRECHGARSPIDPVCWAASVNGHPIVHQATGRRCIPALIAAQELLFHLTHYWRTIASKEPLTYHGWLLDETAWVDPDYFGELATLWHAAPEL